MNDIRPTERTRVRRRSQRGSYDRAFINAILDEGVVCHVGLVVDGQPVVLPVLMLPVQEASAKARSGPPIDDDEDMNRPCWAGVVPLRLEPGEPIPDPQLPAGIPGPAAADFRRGG